MSGLEEIVSSLRRKEMERLLIANERLSDPAQLIQTGKNPEFKTNREPVISSEAAAPAPRRAKKESRPAKRRVKCDHPKPGHSRRKKHKTTPCAGDSTDKHITHSSDKGKVVDVQTAGVAGLVEHVRSRKGHVQMKISLSLSAHPDESPRKSLTRSSGADAVHHTERRPWANLANPAASHCSCRGSACFAKFDEATVANLRQQYQALTREELDICLAAKIEDGIHLERVTRKAKKSVQTERKASRTDYWLFGHSICREFFKYVHSVGQDKLTSVMKHYKTAGIEARVHKNKNRRPVHALQERDRQYVVDFIQDYMNTHAICSSDNTPTATTGGVPAMLDKDRAVPVLPKSCTKLKVYELYREFAVDSGFRIPLITTFRRIWRESFPT